MVNLWRTVAQQWLAMNEFMADNGLTMMWISDGLVLVWLMVEHGWNDGEILKAINGQWLNTDR